MTSKITAFFILGPLLAIVEARIQSAASAAFLQGMWKPLSSRLGIAVVRPDDGWTCRRRGWGTPLRIPSRWEAALAADLTTGPRSLPVRLR